jgi:predicted amidophosphoribosyltransferase
MRDCWRVGTFEFDRSKQPVELKVEYSAYAGQTTLGKVLMESFSNLRASLKPKSGWFDFSSEELCFLEGDLPPLERIEGLLKLLSECISVCDDCDMSHCLDVYRTPLETVESPEDWPKTQVGRLVSKAKYGSDYVSARALGGRLLDFVRQHPALATADAVCSVPASSDHGNRLDLPGVWAPLVAEEMRIPVLSLHRTRYTKVQKGFEDREQRRQNQRGSMLAGEGAERKRVLVLDDLYTEGDTMTEAARALREAGADRVFGLCSVKTAKGARGLNF